MDDHSKCFILNIFLKKVKKQPFSLRKSIENNLDTSYFGVFVLCCPPMIPSVSSSQYIKCASLIERVIDITSLTPLVVQIVIIE